MIVRPGLIACPSGHVTTDMPCIIKRECCIVRRISSILIGVLGLVVVLMSGCASVPMASKDLDTSAKAFREPAKDRAGLYVYRDSFGGKALKKMVSVDGKAIGQTANKVYFYREIAPGAHTLSTESEFGDNTLDIQAFGGKNIFVRQYIKMGVFIGGSALELVSDEEGKKSVLECDRAEPLSVSEHNRLPKLAFVEGVTSCTGQLHH